MVTWKPDPETPTGVGDERSRRVVLTVHPERRGPAAVCDHVGATSVKPAMGGTRVG
jgi:hypothetical protein